MLAVFHDLFSTHAGAYARHRPRYPDALFDYLARRAPGRAHAWDAGTGSGQAALGLAARFAHVAATDASGPQLHHATRHERVTYALATVEACPLADHAADVVTAAQALHWFDRDGFFAEAGRVLKPRGILAVWCYSLCHVAPDIDALVQRFHAEVASYWPAGRALVEDGYRSIAFPFDEEPAPAFMMAHRWSADEFLGYLRTWSATQRYVAGTGRNPVADVTDEMRTVWRRRHTVRWPLHLRLGRAGPGTATA